MFSILHFHVSYYSINCEFNQWAALFALDVVPYSSAYQLTVSIYRWENCIHLIKFAKEKEMCGFFFEFSMTWKIRSRIHGQWKSYYDIKCQKAVYVCHFSPINNSVDLLSGRLHSHKFALYTNHIAWLCWKRHLNSARKKRRALFFYRLETCTWKDRYSNSSNSMKCCKLASDLIFPCERGKTKSKLHQLRKLIESLMWIFDFMP